MHEIGLGRCRARAASGSILRLLVIHRLGTGQSESRASHLGRRELGMSLIGAMKDATPLAGGIRVLEAARGWTCTSKVIEALGPHGTLRWRCTVGHAWSASLHAARLLAECRQCAMERKHQDQGVRRKSRAPKPARPVVAPSIPEAVPEPVARPRPEPPAAKPPRTRRTPLRRPIRSGVIG